MEGFRKDFTRLWILVFICVGISKGIGATPVVVPYIIGGEEATPGAFPYIVSIQAKAGDDKWEHLCGGTIVNMNHIVTAAHCAEVLSLIPYRIVAGAHFINRTEETQQIREPDNLKMHHEYVPPNSLNFDIAIIEVAEAFSETVRVKALPIPTDNLVAEGDCQIAGWGQTGLESWMIESGVLMKATVPVVPKHICQNIYPQFNPDMSMCAGRMEGGVDNCNGDTGGPIVCNNMGNEYFAGIASWGDMCAAANKPGVYTDVAKFIQWINHPEGNEIVNDEDDDAADGGCAE